MAVPSITTNGHRIVISQSVDDIHSHTCKHTAYTIISNRVKLITQVYALFAMT